MLAVPGGVVGGATGVRVAEETAAGRKRLVYEAEMVHDFAWMADPARSDVDVTDGASGFNPYRLSQLEDEDRWSEIMGKEAAAAYLKVLRDSLSTPAAAPEATALAGGCRSRRSLGHISA